MTAVEWLVNEILVEVDRYDDEGNKIGIDYWNAYTSCTSLLEYVNKAKEMENKNLNDRLDAIYESILQLHNNEEITGFSKRAYAQCLDIVEQFKNK